MRHRPLLTALLPLTLIGCASLPSPAENPFDHARTITIGSGSPPEEAHILYIPAHQPIPVTLNISGNLMEHSTTVQDTVSIKRDIWVYQNWISYDGKTWQSLDKLPRPNIDMSMTINASGAAIKVNAELIEE